MSGHSHARTILHKKQLLDKKRGKIFSKLSRMISIAASEGGKDPAANPSLRMAIEKAQQANMPKQNIERAIQRGVGQREGAKLEKFLFGAYGPGGIAIIIEGITDNKNRSLSEIKQILNRNQAKLAKADSVKWLFAKGGVIRINIINQDKARIRNKEDLEMLAIEAGAEDIYWRNDVLSIYTKANNLHEVEDKLKRQGVNIESFTIEWVAKKSVKVAPKQQKVLYKLFEDLNQNSAVQEVYSNLKI